MGIKYGKGWRGAQISLSRGSVLSSFKNNNNFLEDLNKLYGNDWHAASRKTVSTLIIFQQLLSHCFSWVTHTEFHVTQREQWKWQISWIIQLATKNHFRLMSFYQILLLLLHPFNGLFCRTTNQINLSNIYWRKIKQQKNKQLVTIHNNFK